MEPFFWPPTRKKLPGKHGQQDLIAAPAAPGETSKPFQDKHFPTWHGFRSVSCEPRLGRALAVRKGIRRRAWEGFGSRIIEGENHRWRIRFSSDFRGRWCWNGRSMSSPTTSRTSTPIG